MLNFGDDNNLTSLERNIFEHPIGSRAYINVYNIHAWNKDMDKNYEQMDMSNTRIVIRNAGFLNEYLPKMPPGNRYRLMPIFLGDMNREDGFPPNFALNYDDICYGYYKDKGVIDHIFAGKPSVWSHHYFFYSEATNYCKMYPKGPYSDHPVYVQEIKVTYAK